MFIYDLNFFLGSLIDARSFAKDNSEVSSNENYVFEENQKNRNKSIKLRSCAGSSKEFIVPKLPTVSSEGNYNSYLIIYLHYHRLF